MKASGEWQERPDFERAFFALGPRVLAGAVGVHWRTTYRWVRGEAAPSPLARQALHRFLADLGTCQRHDGVPDQAARG